MTLQFSDKIRNDRLDIVENDVNSGGTAAGALKFFTGAPPAHCSVADSGTLLDTTTLPIDFMNDAASGSKTLKGSWTSTAAAAGTAGYFRMYDSSGTCHVQGTITAAGGGGDMIASSTSIGVGDTETVTTFTLNEANG